MSLRIKKKSSMVVGLSSVFCVSYSVSYSFWHQFFFYFFQGHISDFLEWQKNLNLANSDKIVPEREREKRVKQVKEMAAL